MPDQPARQDTPPVKLTVGASLVITVVIIGVTASLTNWPDWAIAAVASAFTVTVERTGQWWYGRRIPRRQREIA